MNREIEENQTPKIQEKEEEQTEKQMKQEVIERLKDLTGKYREFLQGKINKADIYFFDRLRDRNEEIIVKFSNKYISDAMLQLLFYCNERIFQIGKSDKYPLDEKTRARSTENCIDTYNKLTPEEKSLLPNDISIIWEKTI